VARPEALISLGSFFDVLLIEKRKLKEKTKEKGSLGFLFLALLT